MTTASVGRIALAAGIMLVAPDLASPSAAQAGPAGPPAEPVVTRIEDLGLSLPDPPLAATFAFTRSRLDADFAVMQAFRPGYTFWQHIFTIPDGSVAFGSAEDGRLLATFPAGGDWVRTARWHEPWLATILQGQSLAGNLSQRRERVASLLEPAVGRVIHNATRGNFLLPNARRYGSFVGEWGAIFERFGVPAEIGIAQAILESGLNGRIQSEARALGFCQWLPANWQRMKRLAHHVVEGYNQTTQAPYCAAYLTILATKYGSFIPALSEHHAGGTNVARAVILGGWLQGQDARERYLLGSQFAYDLREIAPGGAYRDVYGTYGPRSFLYAEMIFGNSLNAKHLAESIPQQRIFAMRTTRAIPLSEITRRTGLSSDEVRRFNPALVQQVPARANLYLPSYVREFGADVSFWHRPPSADYLAVLDRFVRLEASLSEWHEPSFRMVLREFERQFAETGTEEGKVMATVLAYFMEETYTGRRGQILTEYQTSSRVLALFERGLREREALQRRTIAVD